MNDSSLRLYQGLSADSKENLFLSPYSVQAALFRLFLGARGGTEAEMRMVLGISDSPRKGPLGCLTKRKFAFRRLLAVPTVVL